MLRSPGRIMFDSTGVWGVGGELNVLAVTDGLREAVISSI